MDKINWEQKIDEVDWENVVNKTFKIIGIVILLPILFIGMILYDLMKKY